MTDYQPDWWDFLDEYDTEVTNADKLGDTGSNDSGSAGNGRDSLTFEIDCDTTLTVQAIRDAAAKMRDMQVLPFYDETGLPYYARLRCDGDMIRLCDGERFYVSKILADTANKTAHSFDQLASAFCQGRQAGKSGMMDAMLHNLNEARLYVPESQKDLIEDMKGFKWDQRLTLESHPSYDNWIDKEIEKTLYSTPYQGSQIALYDGKNWSINDLQDLPPDGFLRQDPISGCYHAILDPSMAHALINDPGEEQPDGSFKPWGDGLTGEVSRGQVVVSSQLRYSEGTISGEHGKTAVRGHGTEWLSHVQPGSELVVLNGNESYRCRIQQVVSDGLIELDRPLDLNWWSGFCEAKYEICEPETKASYLSTSQSQSSVKQCANTGFKTEVIHYEDYDGEIQWSIVTVNHPEIDWDPARPLPMDAEWAAKPSSVISGFTWTMLTPQWLLSSHGTDHCLEWAGRLVYRELYPDEIGSWDETRMNAIWDLLNENLTVLHTTNVRLKPSSDACFIW